jgi:hypothetical protein
MSKQAQKSARFVRQSNTGSPVSGRKNLNPPGRGGRTGAASQVRSIAGTHRSGKAFRS